MCRQQEVPARPQGAQDLPPAGRLDGRNCRCWTCGIDAVNPGQAEHGWAGKGSCAWAAHQPAALSRQDPRPQGSGAATKQLRPPAKRRAGHARHLFIRIANASGIQTISRDHKGAAQVCTVGSQPTLTPYVPQASRLQSPVQTHIRPS